jgi:hypothetical protein
LGAQLFLRTFSQAIPQKKHKKAKKWAEEGARLYPNHFPLKKLQNRLKAE